VHAPRRSMSCSMADMKSRWTCSKCFCTYCSAAATLARRTGSQTASALTRQCMGQEEASGGIPIRMMEVTSNLGSMHAACAVGELAQGHGAIANTLQCSEEAQRAALGRPCTSPACKLCTTPSRIHIGGTGVHRVHTQ
jgi:hypothetical protein